MYMFMILPIGYSTVILTILFALLAPTHLLVLYNFSALVATFGSARSFFQVVVKSSVLFTQETIKNTSKQTEDDCTVTKQ